MPHSVVDLLGFEACSWLSMSWCHAEIRKLSPLHSVCHPWRSAYPIELTDVGNAQIVDMPMTYQTALQHTCTSKQMTILWLFSIRRSS